MYISGGATITTQLQRLLLIVGALIAITCIITVYSNILLISSHYLYHTDFFKFYQSARFYFSGQHIYDKVMYPLNDYEISIWHSKVLALNSDLNPPFLTLLLLPTAWLSYSNALLDWFAISLVSTIIGILLTLKTYPALWQNTTARLWALAGLLVYFPNYLSLYIGQLSSLLLILTVLAWYAINGKRDGLAGSLLGFALSIKLFYGIFLILFFARKQWRAVYFMLVTFGICSVSALWIFGIKSYQTYLLNLKEIYWYSGNWNASLLGFLARLFGGNHEGNHPIVNLPQLTQALYFVISAIIISYFIYNVWSMSIHRNIIKKTTAFHSLFTQQDRDIFDWQYSLAIVLMLLLSPLGWIYYFPLLIIPFVTILRLSNLMRRFNLYFILLNIIIIFSSIPYHYRFPMQITQPVMIFTWASYSFYALIALCALLLLMKRQLFTLNYNDVNDAVYRKMTKFNNDDYANADDLNSQQISSPLQIIMLIISATPSLLALSVAIQSCVI